MRKVCFYSTLSLLLGIVAGCTKEKCVTCPPDQPAMEKEYQFLYGWGWNNYTYTYSTKTGHTVDSVIHQSLPFLDMRFSNDGRYAFYSSDDGRDGVTWMTDCATGDTLSTAHGVRGWWLSVSADDKYLLISGTTKLTLLVLPGLTVVYQRVQENGWGYGAVHALDNTAYVPFSREDSLLILNFRNSPVTDSSIPLFRGDGAATRANVAAVTKDGKYLILDGGFGWQVRDAETLKLLREYRYVGNTPYVHPDGVRIFFPQPADVDAGIPAELWVLDLRTMFMTRVLTASDVRGSMYSAGFDPNTMDFTPDGRYAFILNGGLHWWDWGAIIKIDCDSYKIVDAFWPPSGLSTLIHVNPKEIK